MVGIIMDGRKWRELDPTVLMLRECAEALDEKKADEAYTEERLNELLGLVELTSAWCERRGLVLLVLGAMHFFNMFNFDKMRKKARQSAAGTVAPVIR